MVILDTDCLTLLQRAEGEAHQRLLARLRVAAQTRPIFVTVITIEEQLRGWLAQIARQRSAARQVDGYARLLALVQDLAARATLPFDEIAARRFEGLRNHVRIGTMDLKIAAITLAQGATLVSRNLRDYSRVPGLLVEDWTAP